VIIADIFQQAAQKKLSAKIANPRSEAPFVLINAKQFNSDYVGQNYTLVGLKLITHFDHLKIVQKIPA